MSLKNFNEQQKQAMLDLAVLAMYSDGHLAAAEDERILRLLAAMEHGTDYDCGKQYNEALTRVSRHSPTVASARAYIATLAQLFTTREQQRIVLDLVDDLVSSDSKVSPQEGAYLAVVREAFSR
jgi:hypothetical protein